tara:strand:- start:2894 stop:3853 length:960 start_codon:yes stop_codon:yes gene_type:complete
MKKKLFNQISIIGLGLIGSSLALALKKKKIANKVIGYARSSTTRRAAKKLNLVDKVANTLVNSVKGSDLIVICTPLSTYVKISKEILPHLEMDAIVTDVGSAKVSSISEVSKYFDKSNQFIPAHPIAGTEQSGPYAGFPELFINRWCIITPLKNNKSSSVSRIKSLWKLLGSKVEVMSPERHDRLMAITSHLPHLISYNIVSTAADLESVSKQEIIKYSASGFRDFTRLASSDPVMWRDIFLKNKDAVLEMIGRFSEDLSALQKAVRWGDGKSLYKIFSKTRKVREKIILAGQDTDAADFGRSKVIKKFSKVKNRNKKS